jgi:hypothetical protein
MTMKNESPVVVSRLRHREHGAIYVLKSPDEWPRDREAWLAAGYEPIDENDQPMTEERTT